MGREAELGERREVLGRAVALVGRPRVRRMAGREQLHQVIAHGLRDDRGSGDRVAVRIPVHDGIMRTAQLRAGQAVHQDEGRRDPEPVEGTPHGEDRGPPDVQPVDFAHARRAPPHGQCAGPHHAGEPQAALRQEQLRVAQSPDNLAVRWKHDGRGHHWTSQGTAARFVDTGDDSAPRSPERDLALERGAGASHASCFSAVSGTVTPRFSRIRAALPASRRRKYSLARRTRPLRTSSISAMDGACSGKMRSTPTPAEILRTVNVALIPAPRRPMQIPSNACSRSLSPSRTRTITRTVSPGSNAGMLVLSPSRSTARSLFISLTHRRRDAETPRRQDVCSKDLAAARVSTARLPPGATRRCARGRRSTIPPGHPFRDSSAAEYNSAATGARRNVSRWPRTRDPRARRAAVARPRRARTAPPARRPTARNLPATTPPPPTRPPPVDPRLCNARTRASTAGPPRSARHRRA